MLSDDIVLTNRATLRALGAGPTLLPLAGIALLTSGAGPGLPAVGTLAVDDTDVYWTDPFAGNVMKAPKGGGAPTTISTGQQQATFLALDATNVYWQTGAGAIVKMPKTGGGLTAIASGQTNVTGFAVDATNVYWVTSGASVMKVAIAGGGRSRGGAARIPRFLRRGAVVSELDFEEPRSRRRRLCPRSHRTAAF